MAVPACGGGRRGSGCGGGGGAAQEGGGERERGHQQHGVGEVDGLRDDAAGGGVVLDPVAEDQKGSEEGFGEEQRDGPQHGAAGTMAARGDGEGPEGEGGEQEWCRCRRWSGG